MSEVKPQENIFINGKKQIIDMLKYLGTEERAKLLNGVALRNPALARELGESCLSFQNVYQLNEEGLAIIFNNIPASMVALCLKFTPQVFQKTVLSVIDRNLAVESYQIMLKLNAGHQTECSKAQDKVLSLAINLSKKGVIKL